MDKAVLGKGLASLLSSTSAPSVESLMTPESNKDRHPGISLANIDDILENPYQPRKQFNDESLKELQDSIASSGIIQPLVVRKAAKGYELIAGERRLRAAKLAGLKQIPIVIRRSTDLESLALAIIENVQRENLNCIDEAIAYDRLITEFSLTQEEVAVRVGKDRATVANLIRLLKLPETIRSCLKSGELSAGHGKILVGIEDERLRDQVFKDIQTMKMSVRATEARLLSLKQELPKENPNDLSENGALTGLRLRFKTLADDLMRYWSYKINIQGSEKKGKIIFHYHNREELDRLLATLQSEKQWHQTQNSASQ